MQLITPREKTSLETRRRILEATGTLIRQYDFRYLTVKNISEAAGISPGSFFHHFGSKDQAIYMYCKSLLDKMLETNPTPASVNEDDFIRIIIWNLLVYAKFCELMGKDIIRYLSLAGSEDMFYGDHFQRLVRNEVRKGFEKGVLCMGEHPERLSYISDDVAVCYKGVIASWINDMEIKSHRGRLCVGMEHIAFRVLSGFRSARYYEIDEGPFQMFTDDEDFDRAFTVIPELRSGLRSA